MQSQLYLPIECLHIIFQNIANDTRSLHSCILVNRFWCRNAIPYLWARPLTTLKTAKLIKTYISCLENEDKALIKEDVTLPVLPQPLFDYASYLLEFIYYRLRSGVELWIKIKYQLPTSLHNDPKVLGVTSALCNLLMRKCSRLEAFSINSENIPDYTIFSQSPYLSRIKEFSHLSLDEYLYPCNNNILDLLKLLPKLCKDIQALKYDQRDSVNKAMEDIIFTTTNLQDFKYHGYHSYEDKIILQVLKLQTKNLSSLHLKRVSINDQILDMLSECVNLETLTFLYCACEYSSFGSFLKLKFRLKKLHLDSTDIVKFVRTFGNNDTLQCLYIKRLINATSAITILKECSNIVEFYFNGSGHKSNYLFYLLSNLKVLERLTLMDLNLKDHFYNSLGMHLPLSIKYLKIDQSLMNVNTGKFHHLFKNCKASLKTIIINQPVEYNDSDFDCIIDYIRKKNSLMFLGLALDRLGNTHRQRFKELREVYNVFIIPEYDLGSW